MSDAWLGLAGQTIIRNQAECWLCDDHICSFGRHSFITCKCGTLSVDGGRDYLRRVYHGDGAAYHETSIVVPEDISREEAREVLVYLKAFDKWPDKPLLSTRQIVQGAASVMYDEQQKWNRRPLNLKGPTELDTERLCYQKLEKMELWGPLVAFAVLNHSPVWRRRVRLAPDE